VRADAIGQAVENRRDLEIALEHAEAALDVGADTRCASKSP
jgi:hypothetical protein